MGAPSSCTTSSASGHSSSWRKRTERADGVRDGVLADQQGALGRTEFTWTSAGAGRRSSSLHLSAMSGRRKEATSHGCSWGRRGEEERNVSYRNQSNWRDQPESQVRVDLLTWTSASLSPTATTGESGGAVGGDVTSCSCSAGQAGAEPILGGARQRPEDEDDWWRRGLPTQRKTMRKSQTNPVESPWQQSDCVRGQTESGGRGEAEV